MRRVELIRVMVANFMGWLRREMDPSGKAAVQQLEARALALVDAWEPADGYLPEVADLGPDAYIAGLGGVLSELKAGSSEESAVLAAELLRVLLRRNVSEIAQFNRLRAAAAAGVAAGPKGGVP